MTSTPVDPLGSESLASPASSRRRLPWPWIGGAAVLGLGALLLTRGEAPLAKVDSVSIGQPEFAHRLELAAGPQVLQQMVNEEMDLALARKAGVYPTDAEVQAKLDEAKKQPDFAKQLEQSRQTEADLRRGILVKLAQQNVVTKGVEVTDAEVKEFYDKNASANTPNARYYTPDAVQVAAIVLPNKALADAAYADLASGATFAAVAQSRTVGPNPDKGGLLPPFVKGKTDTKPLGALADVIWKMKVGDQTSPQPAAGRWWIVRCVGRSQEGTVPFVKVKDEYAQLAKLDKGLKANGAAIQSQLDELKASSPLQVLRPEYKDLIKVK